MCSKCKPREQLLSEEESEEGERESLEFSSEEEFDEEQVISFRDREPELDEEMGDTDEVITHNVCNIVYSIREEALPISPQRSGSYPS
jgi:hypothetical protein